MLAPVLAVLVAAVTLLLILTRPGRLSEPLAALLGAGAMLLLGLVPPRDAVLAVAGAWNIFLFFLGLMLAAAAAERAGVFELAADLVARLARGNARLLLVWIFGLGSLVTAFLSNDATALLLTPIVFTLARRLKVPPLPYAYACALAANAASFILPVSNPANLLVLSGVPMSLATFVSSLWLASLVSVLMTLGGLLLLTWGELHRRYTPPPVLAPSWRTVAGLIGLAVLTAGYLLADRVGVPLGVVAGVGGALLVTLDGLVAGWHPREVTRHIAWGLLVLLAGLTVVVAGLEHAGATGPLASGLGVLASMPTAGPPAVALATALGSNVVNNLPMALIAATGLRPVEPEAMAIRLAAGAIVGIDLGPNITTVGSFATMLWLTLLRRRGQDVSARAYTRVGLIVTLPALLGAAAALVLTG